MRMHRTLSAPLLLCTCLALMAFTACSVFAPPPPAPKTFNQAVVLSESSVHIAIVTARNALAMKVITKAQAQAVENQLTAAESKLATARSVYALYAADPSKASPDKLDEANNALSTANDILLAVSQALTTVAPTP